MEIFWRELVCWGKENPSFCKALAMSRQSLGLKLEMSCLSFHHHPTIVGLLLSHIGFFCTIDICVGDASLLSFQAWSGERCVTGMFQMCDAGWGCSVPDVPMLSSVLSYTLGAASL